MSLMEEVGFFCGFWAASMNEILCPDIKENTLLQLFDFIEVQSNGARNGSNNTRIHKSVENYHRGFLKSRNIVVWGFWGLKPIN